MKIESWSRDYYKLRPHSEFTQMTPTENATAMGAAVVQEIDFLTSDLLDLEAGDTSLQGGFQCVNFA